MSLISNATATSAASILLPHAEIDQEIERIISENNGKRPDRNSFNRLLRAAVKDNIPLRIKALITMGADLNRKDLQSGTILHNAVILGHEEALLALLDGKDIDLTIKERW